MKPVAPMVIDDYDPKRLVSGNRRIHHHQRAQVASYWRTLAYHLALREYGHAEEGEAWHQRVRIVITFRFPDLRRRDVSNLYPFVAKPLVDGLVDARLLPDDNDHHLIGPDLRRDLTRGPRLIRIDVEDQEAFVPNPDGTSGDLQRARYTLTDLGWAATNRRTTNP